MLVVAPRPGAGATMTASNLAVSLARAGQRTLLIDAGLRRASLGRLHALVTDHGLNQLLRGEGAVSQAIQRCPVEKLDGIAAGLETLNQAPLLPSPRFRNILAEVRPHYDVVIVDSPAVLEGTEACILASMADGVLLVVREGVTERADAEEAVRLLRKRNAPLLGAVFNDVQWPEAREADRLADLLADVDWQEKGTAPAEPERNGYHEREVTRNGNPDR